MKATRQSKPPSPAGEAPEIPHLPRMVQLGNVLAPAAPADLDDTGLDRGVLVDLTLKYAFTVPQFTTEQAARRIHVPFPLVQEMLEQLTTEHMVEVLGQVGPFNMRYIISQRGRERAGRLLEVSGYIGPAPVSLEAYTAMLEWQLAHFPKVSPKHVLGAVADLVLPTHAVEVAGLAISSGRSLFIFGPSGNGKTSLGRLIHNAQHGELWIPHCIGVESSIIRVFDEHYHEASAFAVDQNRALDQRWVRVRRPLIVVGGEVTMDSFELAYSPSVRYYEAPLHFKANGGAFLIDDFGRERVDPHQLLNRWITPLEHQIDYLTLQTGQKIQVPFRQMLLIATNLNPDIVMDPAFLRRMGYRLYLGNPTQEQYQQILERYAARKSVTMDPKLVTRLMERYQSEERELRACEPRDLIERVHDICRYRGKPVEVNEETLDLAWMGYFGNK